MQNLVGALREHAIRQPERIAYRFVKGTDSESVSYAQLVRAVAAKGDSLRALGLARGDRIVIGCSSPRAFAVAFHACLAGGFIAVPVAVPRRAVHVERLAHVLADCQARALVTDDESLLRSSLAEVEHVVDACADGGDPTGATSSHDEWTPGGEADTAFLQYTSGSTGDPKGVMVTHGGLMANCFAMSVAMSVDGSSRILTALPLFHDMGLIGGLLVPIFAGCEATFMEGAELVMHPSRWLRHLSDLRITITGGPNYMYDLGASVASRQDAAGVRYDLSALRIAFCGAEPVRARVAERFVAAMAPHGFRRDAFFPCYGLAEATLFVAGGALDDALVEHSPTVLACGVAGHGVEIAIVDPHSRIECTAGTAGEIWVAGESLGQGYWRRPELSAQTFAARLGDAPERGPFLRTGDIGMIVDGRLHVTGRLKDLIIINGRNYAPHDLEDTARSCHDALLASEGAAFSHRADDGVERLVIFHEVGRSWWRRTGDHPAIVGAVRESLAASHGIRPDRVVLLRPGQLPRTSSGKVRRSACRDIYLAQV